MCCRRPRRSSAPTQAAQLAELRVVARRWPTSAWRGWRSCSDTVPRKEIEAAAGRAGQPGRASRRRRRRPERPRGAGRAGVRRHRGRHVVAGQVVDARELCSRSSIRRACASRRWPSMPALAGRHRRRQRSRVGSERLPLQFVGAARALREQALPLHFSRTQAQRCSRAGGRPARAASSCRHVRRLKGIAVPAACAHEEPGQPDHRLGARRRRAFRAAVVATEPLDGANVTVTAGLKAGDRVATQGASLINQVR